jgi:PAS domain-containing protein
VTKIASRVANCPTSIVSIIGLDTEIASTGARADGTGLDAPFCVHVARTGAPLVVPDATLDRRFCDNLLVRSYPGIRFYAGVPVTDGLDEIVGVLCVIDYVPRHGLPARAIETLTDLAELASDRLSLATGAGKRGRGAVQRGLCDGGNAILVVDDSGEIVHWNDAAERLLAAYADDLWRADAERYLPNLRSVVRRAAAPRPDCREADGSSVVALVRADGRETLAVAAVAREFAAREPRYRITLRACEEGD